MKTMKLVALTGEELALLKRFLDPKNARLPQTLAEADAEVELATDLLSTLNGVTPDTVADAICNAARQAAYSIGEVLGEEGYEATTLDSCECENERDEVESPCIHMQARFNQQAVHEALKKIAPSVEEPKRCSVCRRAMGDEECGDEFPEERVCDACADKSKTEDSAYARAERSFGEGE